MDYYEEHIAGKQKRKNKKRGRGKRNPIASSHNRGKWCAGPMEDKVDKLERKGKRVVMEDFDDYKEVE